MQFNPKIGHLNFVYQLQIISSKFDDKKNLIMNLTATLYSIRKQVKNSLCGLLLICFGCTHQPKMPAVHVTLVDSNQSVTFKVLDYAIVSEINRDSTTGIWKRH